MSKIISLTIALISGYIIFISYNNTQTYKNTEYTKIVDNINKQINTLSNNKNSYFSQGDIDNFQQTALKLDNLYNDKIIINKNIYDDKRRNNMESISFISIASLFFIINITYLISTLVRREDTQVKYDVVIINKSNIAANILNDVINNQGYKSKIETKFKNIKDGEYKFIFTDEKLITPKMINKYKNSQIVASYTKDVELSKLNEAVIYIPYTASKDDIVKVLTT